MISSKSLSFYVAPLFKFSEINYVLFIELTLYYLSDVRQISGQSGCKDTQKTHEYAIPINGDMHLPSMICTAFLLSPEAKMLAGKEIFKP